jgi:hypothetical protein
VVITTEDRRPKTDDRKLTTDLMTAGTDSSRHTEGCAYTGSALLWAGSARSSSWLSLAVPNVCGQSLTA